jgi:DNA-binding transcriptional regulator LsrR (DeoR family)
MSYAVPRQSHVGDRLFGDRAERAAYLWWEERKGTYEIAIELGTSEAAVYNTLSRGKEQALQELLREEALAR